MDPTLAPLLDLLAGRRLVVLTGAGISTDSGIPDYRGPDTRHLPRRPIQHQEFVRQPEARQRYWSRSLLGWPRLRAARPNAGHRAVARLEQAGLVEAVITQNVDGLHQAAGSRRVIELHGALSRVCCLSCGAGSSRDQLQGRLLAANPEHPAGQLSPLAEAEAAPDGDAELALGVAERFAVPPCAACGGVLMPDVVFFGGTVPAPRVQEAYDAVEAAGALLVLGSSLAVFSGYRFVRRAASLGRPVAIVSLGPTRGDPHATVKVDAPLGRVLPTLAQALSGSAGPGAALPAGGAGLQPRR